MLPKTILVPTDLSEGGAYALDYACELAAKLGATVHLLNVISIPFMAVPEAGSAIAPTVLDSVIHENQVALDKLADARREKASIGETLLHTGDARDDILHTAETLGADLIVMGTHGRSGFMHLLLGSVAERVVRTAKCPVLTVRPDAVTAAAGEDVTTRFFPTNEGEPGVESYGFETVNPAGETVIRDGAVEVSR